VPLPLSFSLLKSPPKLAGKGTPFFSRLPSFCDQVSCLVFLPWIDRPSRFCNTDSFHSSLPLSLGWSPYCPFPLSFPRQRGLDYLSFFFFLERSDPPLSSRWYAIPLFPQVPLKIPAAGTPFFLFSFSLMASADVAELSPFLFLGHLIYFFSKAFEVELMDPSFFVDFCWGGSVTLSFFFSCSVYQGARTAFLFFLGRSLRPRERIFETFFSLFFLTSGPFSPLFLLTNPRADSLPFLAPLCFLLLDVEESSLFPGRSGIALQFFLPRRCFEPARLPFFSYPGSLEIPREIPSRWDRKCPSLSSFLLLEIEHRPSLPFPLLRNLLEGANERLLFIGPAVFLFFFPSLTGGRWI